MEKKYLSNKPDIVVCISAYNEEKYIERTILEYLKQVKSVAYNIIVVDNASTDNTRKIAEKLIGKDNVCREEEKGLLNAREAGRKYIKDKYNSAKILLQADADIIPATNRLIEAHFKQYENDSNVVGVGGYYEVENRKKLIKLFYFIENLLKGRLNKSYFEKRQFYLDKGIIPVSGANMSYLLEYTDKVKKQTGSSFAEDFYYITQILEVAKKYNPDAYIKLLDEKNYGPDAKIFVSPRDDNLVRIIMNRGNCNILEELMKTGNNPFKKELKDVR